MRYLNASQAAKRIGVADKTIRRWLAEGENGKYKLTAVRTPSNRLAIPESEVDRVKRTLEQERSQFVSSESLDTSGSVIEALEARILELEQEVATHRERIALLEQSKSTPPSVSTRDINQLSTKAQKRIVARNREVPPDLPSGTLSASDFSAKIGISYDDLKNYMRRGIYGEKLDITEVPHPSRADYVQKFFTPEQQEKARALLSYFGKLPNETEK
jgi:transposase